MFRAETLGEETAHVLGVVLDHPLLHCSGGHQSLALDEMEQEATEGANVVHRLGLPMAVVECCTRRYSASDVVDEIFELSER